MRRPWDVVVIGAGVAGLTAARVVAGAGLACAVIDRLGPGGVLINLGRIHGVEPETNGADFAASLLDAAVEAGAELVIGEARAVSGGPPWVVTTDEEEHEAPVVILATGLSPGRLGVAGEEAFEGRGLSHCAFCDGPMFAGQRVVVSGDDKWALQEAIELAEVAAHVSLVGPPPGPLPALANLAVMPGRVVALHGAEVLASVEVEQGGRRERLAASGVFAYADRRPQLEFAASLLALDASGRAVVDADLVTSAAGLFAIGDLRAGASETVTEAIADARRAGLAAARHLQQHGASQ